MMFALHHPPTARRRSAWYLSFAWQSTIAVGLLAVVAVVASLI